jgi:peptide-methionine (R)-S-oxide reductase
VSTKDPAFDLTLAPAELSRADWESLLSPVEYAILREASTERPGTGRYLHNERSGAYHCAGCGSKLYGAEHKFHSGCGWPSFFQAAEEGALKTIVDRSHGMVRTEMRCARCEGHLGHIFPDAPQTPTGTRHCVNGFALVFVPDGEDPQAVLRAHREGR